MKTLRIFINYRRADAGRDVGRLFDWLEGQFGRDHIFLDTYKIGVGVRFAEVLQQRLSECDVVLAVIGPQWLQSRNEHGLRLEQNDDFVRLEIEAALACRKRIVPLLLGGGELPAKTALPPSLQPLLAFNTASIRTDAFDRDFEHLVDRLLDRDRGYARRQLDRWQRAARLAGRTALGVPLLVAALLVMAWMQLFDALALDTQVASHLLRVADALGPDLPPTNLRVVAIDRESEARLGHAFPGAPGSWRGHFAALVRRAHAAGARAVVFDVAMGPLNPPVAGDALVRAAAQAAAPAMRTVVAVTSLNPDGSPRMSAEIAPAVAWGSACLVQRLAYLYFAPLAVAVEGSAQAPGLPLPANLRRARFPALSAAALMAAPPATIDIDARWLSAGDGTPLPFTTLERQRWARGACGTLAEGDLVAMAMVRPSPVDRWRKAPLGLSFADVLDSARVPDSSLRGRILLVGATDVSDAAVAAAERFGQQRGLQRVERWGVELHADAIATMESGRTPAMLSAGAQLQTLVASALAGVLLAAVAAAWKPWRRRALLAAAALLYLALAAACAAWFGVLAGVCYDLAALVAGFWLLRRIYTAALRRPSQRRFDNEAVD